ncbi:MAG: 2-oxoacid:acceptor oxidoreductase family protein [Anaerolineae bacterium]|nr:2-oxoacid:acceptor oxidoreductase family protein [Anaerolineae bacterium]
MPALTTYRNDRPYGFCPGCSHRLVLDALDRALVRLQWDPAETVIVSDIGCVGLSDQYFITSAFHGLHGRSLTYATGIKLAQPELHVINLIGDGGCGIGCAHLVSAARRNIGVTTLVLNNLNFGMTGGEHSVTTPPDQKTATTPWGNPDVPLDIAQTVAVNGATFVWRGTAFAPDLDAQIAAALAHDGFALLDIWELCVAYYAATNRVSPRALQQTMDDLGFASGRFPTASRPEATAALRELWREQRASRSDDRLLATLAAPLAVRFAHHLDRPCAMVIAGAAGMHVRAAGHLIGTAATLSGLWTAQRDDYPVTVRAGHSLSELVLSPEAIDYGDTSVPDVLFVLSAEGWAKVADTARQMRPDQVVFVLPELVDAVTTAATVRVLRMGALQDVPAAGRSLAFVAAGMAARGYLSAEALLAAAGQLSPAYAQVNTAAVEVALGLGDDLFARPLEVTGPEL